MKKITTICNGESQEWSSREEAYDEFFQAALNTEGREQQRYMNILKDLESGKTVCTDEF